MTTITIPLGATVRVLRQNGSIDTYKFRGTDSKGLILEDPAGARHTDFGIYKGIAVDLP